MCNRHLTASIMSSTALFRALCVKGGTHPFIVLAKKASPQWLLEGDIRACFDEISHDWLLTHIPMDKVILRKWLKAGTLERNVLHPTEAGTPQGGICSPVIAHLVLDGLEAHVRKAFPRYVWQG